MMDPSLPKPLTVRTVIKITDIIFAIKIFKLREQSEF